MRLSSYLKSFLMVSIITLTSYTSRQVLAANIVVNNIEHAATETYQQKDVRYSIKGVVQYNNGRVVRLTPDNSPILIQMSGKLVLGNYIKNSPVYINDVVNITEVYDLPDDNGQKYSFGKTASRFFNVEGYKYLCKMSDRTYYFNIGSQLK